MSFNKFCKCFAAFVLFLFFSTPAAFAQTTQNVPAGLAGEIPRPFKAVGDMGVDLKDGSFSWSETDVTIGAGSFPQSLSLVRTYNSAFANVDFSLGKGTTHNFDIRLFITEFVGDRETKIAIRRGFDVETFTRQSDGTYKNDKGGNSTLSVRHTSRGRPFYDTETIYETLFTFRLGDGSYMTFDSNSHRDAAIFDVGLNRYVVNDDLGCSKTVFCKSADRWNFPDGNYIDFNYSSCDSYSFKLGNGYDCSGPLNSVVNSHGNVISFVNTGNSGDVLVSKVRTYNKGTYASRNSLPADHPSVKYEYSNGLLRA
jgi:hypothetical protein